MTDAVTRRLPWMGAIALALAAFTHAAPLLMGTADARSVALQRSARPWSLRPVCELGTLECVDGVVTQMTQRFRNLAKSCDHDAVFALLYLRTTEEYRRTVATDPNFFVDTPYVNREDAVFADDYFGPYDNWHANSGPVPAAWAIAFEAAEYRQVSGGGNILLGMNAHINRDLPFVLARLGLTHADGSSRKPDHDKVNEILLRVARGPVLDEAASRFDPSIRNSDVPGTQIDNDGFFQTVVAWRERAWHNAVRLARTTAPVEWQLVAEEIEHSAAAHAEGIKASSAYRPPMSSSAARDAYCAAQ